MNTRIAALRYALLRAEVKRRLSAAEMWSTLPGLLDELHSLRQQGLAGGAMGLQDRAMPEQQIIAHGVGAQALAP